MAVTTPLALITLALRDSGVNGVGQTPSAEDANDAFTRLNWILAQWNADRWMIWHLLDIACVATGANSYTVGPGADFDCVRPDRIEAGFWRQTPTAAQPVDVPLRILEAREDYNRISVKHVTGPPINLFYDAAYPVGVLYPWPVPTNSTYEIHISVRDQLTEFTSLQQTINLPHIYTPALHYMLCCMLRPGYQLSADPQIVALAKRSLAVIRGSNAQVPRLRMPGAVMPQTGFGGGVAGGVLTVFTLDESVLL